MQNEVKTSTPTTDQELSSVASKTTMSSAIDPNSNVAMISISNTAEQKELNKANKGIKKLNNLFAKLTSVQKEIGTFVLLPTIFVLVYSAFVWSPMYISETKFAVRSGTEQSYGDRKSVV